MGAAAVRDAAPERGARVPLEPAAIGWLAAIPCMGLTALAVLVSAPR